MATQSRCLATTGPQNTCLQKGSGLGLSHGLCGDLSYSSWPIHAPLSTLSTPPSFLRETPASSPLLITRP